ncbi:MAG: hypothetical protein V3V62_05650 [bacterium]
MRRGRRHHVRFSPFGLSCAVTHRVAWTVNRAEEIETAQRLSTKVE